MKYWMLNSKKLLINFLKKKEKKSWMLKLPKNKRSLIRLTLRLRLPTTKMELIQSDTKCLMNANAKLRLLTRKMRKNKTSEAINSFHHL